MSFLPLIWAPLSMHSYCEGQFDDEVDENPKDEWIQESIIPDQLVTPDGTTCDNRDTVDNRIHMHDVDVCEDVEELSPDTEGQFEDADEERLQTNCQREQKKLQDVGDTRFHPPLYRQRYWLVAEKLKEHDIKSVVDFGCAECKVLPIYKSIPSLEDVIGVDIDQQTVLSNAYLSKPLIADHLVKRSRPLRVRLFCGSAADFDVRLQGVEAVTMIEVIEHLYPDTLAAVAHNIFSNIRPRLVVMTTPNVEYNIVFPGGGSGFRHWDHKFEWTRKEFQDWCDMLASSHGYRVEYGGVGDPPADRAHLGYCSQMAVFSMTEDDSPIHNPSPNDVEPYVLLSESNHPFAKSPPLEESVVMATNYYLHDFCLDMQDLTEEELSERNSEECSYDSVTSILKVSLQYLLKFSQLQKFSLDVSTFCKILESHNFNLSEEKEHVFYTLPEQEDDEEEDEEEDFSGTGDTEQDMDNENGTIVQPTEFWTESWDT